MTNREAFDIFTAWFKAVRQGPSITPRDKTPHRQELEWRETAARRERYNRELRREYQARQSEVADDD